MRHFQKNRSGRIQRKGTDRAGRILFGLFLTAAALLLLLCGFAWAIHRGSLPIESASWIGKGCFTAALLIGCRLSVRRGERHRLLKTAVVGIGSLTILYVLISTFGQTGPIRFWIPSGLCAGAILVSAAISGNKKSHGYG